MGGMESRTSPHPEPRRPNRWQAQDYVLFGVLAAIALGVAPLFIRLEPEKTEWHDVYVDAALRMRAHEPINVVEASAYAYPPAMALLTTLLTFGPLQLGAALWYVVNILCGGVLIVGAWRLSGGPPLVGLPRRPLAIFTVAMLINLRYTIAPLQHQQFDLVIAASAILGGVMLWRGRDRTAGVWLGIAAAMKCTPLLFAPYLLWRRKFAAAALLVGVAVGLNVLPDVVYPQKSGRLYVQDWLDSFAGMAARQGPGTWYTEPSQNQSLAGTFARWTGAVRARWVVTDEGDLPPTPPWLRAAVLGTGLGLLLITLWRCGRPFQPPEMVPADAPRPVPLERLQVGMEMSAGVCLMLLLSPMTGKAHFALMLLPCFLITRAVFERPRPAPRGVVRRAVSLRPANDEGHLGQRAWRPGAVLGNADVLCRCGTGVSVDHARLATSAVGHAASMLYDSPLSPGD